MFALIAAPTVTTTTMATTTVSTGDAGTPKVEDTHIRAILEKFRKFDLPKFLGKNDESWAVEHWVAHIEKLFRDMHIEEQDNVHLATDCLEGEVY